MLELLRLMLGGRDGRSGPSLDRLLAHLDRELGTFTAPVDPSPQSKPRTPFDGSGLSFEQRALGRTTLSQRARLVPTMLPLMWGMQRSATMYDREFQPTKAHADPEFLAELEAGARERGASAVRYVEVPQTAIFASKQLPCRYSVVMTVEMDKDKIETAPSFEAFLEVAKGYRRLATISNWVAKRLRKAGFAGYPGTALGGLTDYPHLAELAGLGAIGYHGLLISPESGPRLRINTVYTNIENLPLARTEDHAWVREFCSRCRRCIRECPVEAIYPEPEPRGDGGMQCIDHDTCREYFDREFGCAVCLAVCPFSVKGYAAIQSRFKGNPDAPRFEIPVRLPIVH